MLNKIKNFGIYEVECSSSIDKKGFDLTSILPQNFNEIATRKTEAICQKL